MPIPFPRPAARMLVAPVLVTLTCAGCHLPPSATIQQRANGLIWVFPGVDGGRWSLGRPVRAFRDAGVTAAIEIHDWHRPLGIITNLAAHKRNRADAARIAAEIARYKRMHPTKPVDLVGYSGGGGMAVFVAEALPEDVHVRNIVLAQPALSPDYDLSAALAHVDGKLVNYYSKLDWLVLGLGTAILGTMDRKHTPSAGHLGFTIESAVPDPTLRSRIEQHPWTLDMLPTGHLGNHVSILLYRWNKRYVARYLLPMGGQRGRPPPLGPSAPPESVHVHATAGTDPVEPVLSGDRVPRG